MKKDRITSIALILLVLSSIVLTFKIWISEELWPGGYNSFLNAEKIVSCLPFTKGEDELLDAVAPVHETMFRPDKIVVNSAETGSAIYSGNDEDFDTLNDFSKKVLSQLFHSETNGEAASRKEYLDTIKSPSVIVEYPINVPVQVIGHLFEVSSSLVYDDVFGIKTISVIPDSSSENHLIVYVSGGESILKYHIPFERSELEKILEEYKSTVKQYVSAYELGFYRRDDGEKIGDVQKVVFDPFVLIDTSGSKPKTEVIYGETPFDKLEPSELDLSTTNGIISAFGYNPNSVRKYIAKSGTLVFVEDYSTIKLYKNGVLEYTTTTPKKGINMQIHSEVSDSPQNVLDAVDNVTDILGNVWETLDFGKFPDIRLSASSIDSFSDYTIAFDYRYNGLPVTINSGNIDHAIEMTVKNNLLISLKAYIRNYSSDGELIENPTSLEALDSVFEDSGESEDETELFLGYVDYGTRGKISTHWSIGAKGR